MNPVERKIMRWVYPDAGVVEVEPEKETFGEPQKGALGEIQKAFAELERTFDQAHFDRSHPARSTLRSLQSHVRDLEALLAMAEAESARLAREAEEMRGSVREMRNSVREALRVHHE